MQRQSGVKCKGKAGPCFIVCMIACLVAQGVSTDPEKLGRKAAVVDSKNVLQLLNHCNGSFRPGILTALVGSSGAGKTTLMDVLAGRKTSKLCTHSSLLDTLAELTLLHDSFCRLADAQHAAMCTLLCTLSMCKDCKEKYCEVGSQQGQMGCKMMRRLDERQ